MWGGKKELGVIVEVELKSDKGEQVAIHIQTFSLDSDASPCLLYQSIKAKPISLCDTFKKGTFSLIQGLPYIIPRISFRDLSVVPDIDYVH